MKNIARISAGCLALVLYFAFTYPALTDFWMPGLAPTQNASIIATPLVLFFVGVLLLTGWSAIGLLLGLTAGLLFDRRGYWLAKKALWLLLVFGAIAGGTFAWVAQEAAVHQAANKLAAGSWQGTPVELRPIA